MSQRTIRKFDHPKELTVEEVAEKFNIPIQNIDKDFGVRKAVGGSYVYRVVTDDIKQDLNDGNWDFGRE